MCKNRLHQFSVRTIADSDIDYDESCNYCRHSAQHTFEQHTAAISKQILGKFAKRFVNINSELNLFTFWEVKNENNFKNSGFFMASILD